MWLDRVQVSANKIKLGDIFMSWEDRDYSNVTQTFIGRFKELDSGTIFTQTLVE